MSETWANVLDHHLDVSGPRVRSRLEAALRDAIRSGRLAEDARPAGLVIGYARPPEHAYTTAIARLCAAL
jgi:hypothetical protein